MRQTRPFAVLGRHIAQDSLLYSLYLPHAALVTAKALAAARRLGLPPESLEFVEQAGLLHDIGIARVHESRLGCFGKAPYMQHGVLGREILEAEGLPRHGLVAERHIGVGLTRDEILAQELPLPARDFLPETVEERLIAWADLFFSKKRDELWLEKPPERVRAEMARFGQDKAAIFDEWSREFAG
ncbi:MAG: HDIG domain-containing metalloprotein [Desulfovibrionaceae bacterium]